MKEFSKECAALAICAVLCRPASGYEINNHDTMSGLALNASIVSTQDRLNQLGLLYGITDLNQTFPLIDEEGKPRTVTIRDAVRYGARFEDSGSRPLNHFFNPLTNGPLTVLGASLPNDTSPDWILEDNAIVSSWHPGAPQIYSYRLAKDYLLNALTKPTKAERDKNWGLTFQTLGQVIHHVQDMAQPQHVRNDPHYDKFSVPFVSYPSTYEQWISTWTADTFVQNGGYAPVYSKDNLGKFTIARHFWTTSPNSVGTAGVGMAEYTNRGFFSWLTLPDSHGAANPNFPSPVPGYEEPPVDVADLCKNMDVKHPCPAGVSGAMTFIHTTVNDTLRSQTQDNPRALAHSIFSWDLTSRGLGAQYTLNRFTYESAAQLLIPRAVGYSAGLLNFFFRGQMAITLPSQGVYAVVDHTTAAGSDPVSGGFRTIKLKIQNTTPGTGPGGIEPMGNGKGSLYAVVKFHRNNCYKADLSGEYGSPGVDWNTCRSKDEDIVVSGLEFSPAGIDSAPQEVTFTFPTPVPISGTDMFLQVIYDGKLGDENRSIVVATKDISEPTYLYAWDVHDEFMYAHYPDISINGGNQTYTWPQWCQQAIDAGDMVSQGDCDARLWPTRKAVQFSVNNAPIPGWDPANPPVPQGTWSDISLENPPLAPLFTLSYPTGTYSRAAVLTDATPTNPAIVVTDWNGTINQTPNHQFAWVGGPLTAAKNQKDLATNTLTPTQTWARARGIYVSPADVQWIGNPADVGPLQPSQVIFPAAP